MSIPLRIPSSILCILAALFVLACDGLCAEPRPEEAPRPWTPPGSVSAEERLAIEKALPEAAPAKPAAKRRLLIFDLNVGYPGHGSILHANLAFAEMGRKTGAYETVVSRDPEVFRPESLKRFDAVCLNNTVGNLFEDRELRRSLMEFIYSGGGLLGLHGTTVAFTRWPGAHEDWPEFGLLLGGRGARHRASDEHVFIRLDDPDHPLNRVFGKQGFDYRDEFFRVHEPYSRDRVRVLFSIDVEKTDLHQGEARGPVFREDNDYALAWVRSHGRGRVFYCTIAHNPRVFADPRMLEFYLGAIQFALGDLPAPTLPSSRLTPAVRAQEAMGWRLILTAYSLHRYTFFEAIEKTAQLGLSYIGGLSFHKVSEEIPKNFEPTLTEAELEKIRWKLDSEGVRLVSYYIHRIPADEAGCRQVFEFGRRMGIETFLSEPLPEALDTIERFCDEYGINVAIHNHGKDASPHSWHPEEVLKLCRGRSRRIGACADLGYWMRSGIDPIEGVRMLGDRLIKIQMHDLDERSPEGRDVPWGTGAGRTEALLREIRRLGLRPVDFGLEYSYNWLESMPEMARCIEFFNRVSLQLAKE
ncbi:MAG: ThuA domain-containing protein [Planctomycetes bacterium]|nr:ThuA domain-containing protein [Planctomycetota bacterium]